MLPKERDTLPRRKKRRNAMELPRRWFLRLAGQYLSDILGQQVIVEKVVKFAGIRPE
jgi:hypothetical protein